MTSNHTNFNPIKPLERHSSNISNNQYLRTPDLSNILHLNNISNNFQKSKAFDSLNTIDSLQKTKKKDGNLEDQDFSSNYKIQNNEIKSCKILFECEIYKSIINLSNLNSNINDKESKHEKYNTSNRYIQITTEDIRFFRNKLHSVTTSTKPLSTLLISKIQSISINSNVKDSICINAKSNKLSPVIDINF